jgi:hypothetical protein
MQCLLGVRVGVFTAGEQCPPAVYELSFRPRLIVVCHSKAGDGAKGGYKMGPFLGRSKRHQDKERSEGEEAHDEKWGVAGQLQRL